MNEGNAFRGLVFGLLFATPLWATLGAVAYLAIR